MLTQEDDVEIHALARRGWSVSAIARHTGRDRKTVRKYLEGDGPLRESGPSCLEPFRDYLSARFADDVHVDGTVLFREVAELGFDRSYVTFVRQLRLLGLRPRCEACRTGGHGVTTVIAHEPGEEIQWDWLEAPQTPWGEPAYVIHHGLLVALGTGRNPGQAQADLDRWAIAVSDQRKRKDATIAALASQEGLLALPGAAFPALLEVQRVVSRTAMVAFEGNRYSVPPGLVAQSVTVRARLGELHLEIISPAGRRTARHRRAPAGAGQILQSSEHARLLEAAVLDAFTTQKPCRAKQNRPPGKDALAAAAALGENPPGVVVDLEQYAQIARVAHR